MTIADMIAKRQARWRERHDILYDEQLVTAAAQKILSEAALIDEIRERPYLLIECCFSVVNKDKQTVPFILNEVQRDFIAQLEAHSIGPECGESGECHDEKNEMKFSRGEGARGSDEAGGESGNHPGETGGEETRGHGEAREESRHSPDEKCGGSVHNRESCKEECLACGEGVKKARIDSEESKESGNRADETGKENR